MKNFHFKIFALILAITLALFSMACNPLKDKEPSLPPASDAGSSSLPPASDAGSSSVIKPDNVTSVTVNYAERTQSPNQEEAKLMSAIDKVFTSVVNISNTVTTQSGTQVGVGNGVIVNIDTNVAGDNSCYVFTCYHVVENFNKLEVSIPSVPTAELNGSTYYDYANVNYNAYTFTTDGQNPTVAFIGGDKETDVAVLKLNLSAYPNLTVNKASISNISKYPYSLGQTVFAIGNPGGYLHGTTTTGGISSINRRVSVSDIGEMTLLQIDTAVSHGNSGGGIFNLYGELVGLVNAGNDNYENVGYAIPVTTVSATNGLTKSQDTGFVKIANDLITTAWSDANGNFNYGYVPDRWKLGINVGKSLQNGYAVISSLEPQSIFKDKLFPNDIIVGLKYSRDGSDYSLNFRSSQTPYEDFSLAYDEMKSYVAIGNTVTITVLRDNVAIPPIAATLRQYVYRDTGLGLGA